MSFERIAQLGLILFFIVAFNLYARRKDTTLLALLFISFGMNAFTALAGTLWFPYKVVMLITSLWVIQYKTTDSDSGLLKPYYLLLFISVFVAWVFSPNIGGQTFLQGPMMRPIVQLYTYVSMALLIPFVVSIINTPQRLEWSFKSYNRLSEIVILIGFIHFIFIIAGLEFIPILRPGGAESKFAAFGFEDSTVNRIYGLAGEPKTLATFTLPYIFISLYNYVTHRYYINRLYHLTLLVIGTVVMIYTFSSAILISAALGTIIIPILFNHRFSSRIITLAVTLTIIAFVFNHSGSLFTNTQSNENKKELNMLDVLYERSFGRVEEEKEERYESIALNQIFSIEPQYMLTGFGLGMYNYHLPLPKHSRGVEPIDSGWVVIIMDLGILGLIFFLSIFTYLNKLKSINKFYNNHILDSYIIGAVVGFLSNIGNNGMYQIFLFTGLALASYRISENSVSK